MACDAFEEVNAKPLQEQIIILKSWNEWGEGNYMEPDLRYGDGYIKALRRAIDKLSDPMQIYYQAWYAIERLTRFYILKVTCNKIFKKR